MSSDGYGYRGRHTGLPARALALSVLFGLSGCGQGSPPSTLEVPQPESFAGNPLPAQMTHTVTGTVMAIDQGAQQITIAHDAVASLDWPPMTMSFAIDAGLLNKAPLQTGDKVTFTLVENNGQYAIQDIRRQ